MEFITQRNSINSRKSRKVKVVKMKFETENYWKGRKNRALQQLSRSDNECDHEDFLLPEKRLNRWDIHKKLTNEKENKKIWCEAKWKLKSNPPHLGDGWESLEMPTLERCPTHQAERWTIDVGLLHYYNQDDFDESVQLMKNMLNIVPRELTYEIYKNGKWTTHLL